MGLDASSASKNSNCDTMLAESASRTWCAICICVRIPSCVPRTRVITHRAIKHDNALPQQSRIYVIASFAPALTLSLSSIHNLETAQAISQLTVCSITIGMRLPDDPCQPESPLLWNPRWETKRGFNDRHNFKPAAAMSDDAWWRRWVSVLRRT